MRDRSGIVLLSSGINNVCIDVNVIQRGSKLSLDNGE